MLPPGTQVGDYRIDRHAGSGSFGDVFRATHIRSGQAAALKICPQPNTEASVLQRLNHPGIIPVWETFENEFGHVTVMPFIHGMPLSDLLEAIHRQSRRRLRMSDVIRRLTAVDNSAPFAEPTESFSRFGCRVVLQTAAALAYAHSQHVQHRDVKPENIIVALDGTAYLADWGVAAEAGKRPDISGGTLAYMSTDQLTRMAGLAGPGPATSADPQHGIRQDIFALGVVLYEVAVGRLPFPPPVADGSVVAVAREALAGRQHLADNVARESSVPSALRQIIVHCLCTGQDHPTCPIPYSNVQQIVDDLGRYLNLRPLQHARETPTARLIRHAVRHRRRLLFLMACVAVTGVAFAAERSRIDLNLNKVDVFRRQLIAGTAPADDLPADMMAMLFGRGLLPESAAAARRRAELCHGLGAAFLQRENAAAAVSLLARACRLDPSNGDAFNDLGAARFRLKDFQGAVESFDRALSLPCDHAAVLSNRGAALAAMNRPDAALADFKRALQIDPNNQAARHHLQLLKSTSQPTAF
ncbi:MAG: tetratricopeptide repeat protein [Fuerstiella sp.]